MLYWVEAKPGEQRVMSCDLDGNSVSSVYDLASNARGDIVFGLALHRSNLFASVWKSGKVGALGQDNYISSGVC